MSADITQLHNIITELGLTALPDEKKAALIERTSQLIIDTVKLKVLNLLGEEDLQKLEKLQEEKGVESTDVLTFFAIKVPNMELLYTQAFEEVMEQLLALKDELAVL